MFAGFKKWLGGAAEPAREACSACSSTELELLAPEHYRCRACGYEGGEGRRRSELAARALELELLPEAEKLARARKELAHAHTVTIAAIASCEAPLKRWGGVDLDLATDDDRDRAYAEFATARKDGSVVLVEAYGVCQLLPSLLPSVGTPPPMPRVAVEDDTPARSQRYAQLEALNAAAVELRDWIADARRAHFGD